MNRPMEILEEDPGKGRSVRKLQHLLEQLCTLPRVRCKHPLGEAMVPSQTASTLLHVLLRRHFGDENDDYQ